MQALGTTVTSVALRAQARAQRRSSAFRCKAAKEELEFCRDKVSTPKAYEGKSDKTYKVTFVGAGDERVEVQMPEDMYILNAAEANGIDLPATCRGGICGACVGKVVKGTVDMSDIADLDFVLEKHQQDDGFAILCMARPTSDCEIEAQCDWGNISMSEWKGATFFKGEPVKLWKDG